MRNERMPSYYIYVSYFWGQKMKECSCITQYARSGEFTPNVLATALKKKTKAEGN